MYKLKELNDEDVKRLEKSIMCAYQVYGDAVGVFYLLEKDGQEYILHNEANVFMVISEEEKELFLKLEFSQYIFKYQNQYNDGYIQKR